MGFFDKFGEALIGAGSGVLSGIGNAIFGKKNTDSTNQANMKIAQMNNEWSERMMQKQMDYNTQQWQRESQFTKQMQDSQNKWNFEQWNRENEYNSASNQAARLRAAGLNPALAMSGNNAGVASSVQTAPPSSPSGNSVGLPSPQTPTMQTFNPDFTPIGNSIMGFMNYKMAKERNDAEVKQIHIENQYRAQKLMAEIMETKTRAMSNKARARLDNTIESLQDSIAKADINLKNQQAESEWTRRELMWSQKLLTDKNINTFDKRFDQEMKLAVAQTMNYAANANLSKQEMRREIFNTLKMQYEAKKMKIDASTASKIADYLIEQAKYDAYYRTDSPYGLLQRIGQRVDNYFSPIK